MALRSARDWRHWNRPSNHDMFRLLEDYDQYREGDTSTQLSLGFGWRRQHAVTVWNAMAAVVMVMATYECVENHCLPGGLLPDLGDWERCLK